MEHHSLQSVEPVEHALALAIHTQVSPYVTVTHMGHSDDAWVEVIVPDDVSLTEAKVREFTRTILNNHPEMDQTVPVNILYTTFD